MAFNRKQKLRDNIEAIRTAFICRFAVFGQMIESTAVCCFFADKTGREKFRESLL